MRKIAFGLSLALALSILPALAATPPKAGAPCAKVGTTKTYQGKKFTCIKSGKKNVWNKGEALKSTSQETSKPNSNSNQDSSSASGSTTTQTGSQVSLNGQSCTKENEITRNSEGEFWCLKVQGQLRWSKNTSTTNTSSSNSNTNNNRELKYQNKSCPEVGAGLKDGEDFYRCYFYQSGKLVWRQESGPTPKESESLTGKPCEKSFELTTVKETVYRCLTDGTVDSRWYLLDLSKNDPRTGETCKPSGQKIAVKNGYLLCDPVYGPTSIWKFFEEGPKPTKNSVKYSGVAASGKSCDLSGDTYDVAGGYLECRYVNGASLKWMKINSSFQNINNPSSPKGVETCRLKNADVTPQAWRMPGGEAGFPVVARSMMNNPGNNRLLLVGMDFPEFPGDSSLKSKIEYDSKMIKDWFKFASNGRVTFSIDSIDKWVRSSRPAKDYVEQEVDRLAFDQSGIDKNIALNGQPIIDEITKHVDLRNYETVFVFFPKGHLEFKANLILRNAKFKIKEGEKHINFFSWNADLENINYQGWWFLIHEVLHDFPLPLHAPGNGWINERYTYGLPSWARFQMNWLDDDQIYCAEKDNLKTVDIALSPVEREDNKTKMAIVKISPTKAVVVQAHGIDKWSNIETVSQAFPPGFYGVVTYLVILEDAGARNFGTDGRATSNDDGNDPKYPKWAYYIPVDGTRSFPREFFPEQTSESKEFTKYIAGLGDQFKVEGVKIEFVKSGDYETVRISLDK